MVTLPELETFEEVSYSMFDTRKHVSFKQAQASDRKESVKHCVKVALYNMQQNKVRARFSSPHVIARIPSVVSATIPLANKSIVPS